MRPTLEQILDEMDKAAAQGAPKEYLDLLLAEAEKAEQFENRTWGQAFGEAGPAAERSLDQFSQSLGGGIDTLMRDPSQAEGMVDRFAQGMGSTIDMIAGDPMGAVSGAWEGLKDKYGGGQEIKNTLATDPLGMGLDALAVGTGGASLGLKGLGMVNRSQAVADAARAAGLPPKSLKSLFEVMGGSRLPEARQKAVEIGPDVAAYNLTPGAEAKAAAGMRLDLGEEGRPIQRNLYEIAMGQTGGAATRFKQGALDELQTQPMDRLGAIEAVSPDRELATQLRASQAQTRVALEPIVKVLEEQAMAHGNVPPVLRMLNTIQKQLYDVVNDKDADTRGALQKVRRSIDEMIPGFAPKQQQGSLEELYKVGSRTLRGAAATAVRKTIKEVLQSNSIWAMGDELLHEAEKRLTANQLGREETVGPGTRSVNPRELEARVGPMSLMERSFGRAGLAEALRDVADNLHEGWLRGPAALLDIDRTDPKRRIAAFSSPESAEAIGQLATAQGTLARGAAKIREADEAREKGIGERDMEPPEGPKVNTRQALFGGAGYAVGGPVGLAATMSIPLISKALQPGFRKRTRETLKLLGRKDSELSGLLDVLETAGENKKRRIKGESGVSLKALGLFPLIQSEIEEERRRKREGLY